MTEELPFLYRKMLNLLPKREEITVKEFKESISQTVKARKSEWWPIAKDFERFGLLKIPKNNAPMKFNRPEVR